MDEIETENAKEEEKTNLLLISQQSYILTEEDKKDIAAAFAKPPTNAEVYKTYTRSNPESKEICRRVDAYQEAYKDLEDKHIFKAVGYD